MIWGRDPREQKNPYEPKKVLPLLSGGNLVIGNDGWFVDAPNEDEASKASVADLYGDQAIPIEIEDQMAWLLYRNGLVITTITEYDLDTYDPILGGSQSDPLRFVPAGTFLLEAITALTSAISGQSSRADSGLGFRFLDWIFPAGRR
eukprot:CAMPEP_0172181036 /NCGR_PEP_ID=MMETSP1050-20130122/17589_1 /TAXON_ID=233186 /ORGANISM="Cryptomonas curvata, Strain CCAP979/52" /LENGTH=146 /DNA_ID=CAMNT_0012854263 /DNA_START=228 /DNA_END=664 /DNA_ORIENTATION=-